MNAAAAPSTEPVRPEVEAFLRQHGATGGLQLLPLPGGANNRVYHVPQAAGDWVLKCYFRHPLDPRDRFGAERTFYEWLWSRSIRRTPEPIGWCPERRLGLLTFVPGRKLQPAEVDADRVQEALDFVVELNTARHLPAAQAMPSGSEACFRPAEHLACVDRRVARLQNIETPDALDQQAARFVRDRLVPAWQRLRGAIRQAVAASGTRLDAPLASTDRCLSPSDFGFHNALLTSDGRLRFFDFEYAGWDDPAKLVCDFFCQPQLPVSHGHWAVFLERLQREVAPDPGFSARARLLLPAYQVKWCAIMLNEFVPGEQSRRAYAAGTGLSADRKAAQLAKAEAALAKAVELWARGA
jgi:hypothetical protein